MKNFFKSVLLVIVIFSAVWITLPKLPKPHPSLNNSYQGKITLGMGTWPGYLAFFIARDKGYFKEAGVDVDIQRYGALQQLAKDYIDGKLQGRANVTLETVAEYANGCDQRIVLAIDYSNGADVIIAGNDLMTVKDLQGKRVGYEPNTLGELFLAWVLGENAMSLSDIVPVAVTPQEAVGLLKENTIDAVVSYEPFASKLYASGNFHDVVSSQDVPGFITDVLTFRKDFVQAYPEAIQSIVNAYFKALNFWKNNPEEANAIVAKELATTSKDIAQQLNKIKMMDIEDNKIMFTFAAGTESLYGHIRFIADFIRQYRAFGKDMSDINALIDKKFIKKLHE